MHMSNFDQFDQFHHQSQPFILANAWNVKSAQLIEKADFAAIGTSSGAIANPVNVVAVPGLLSTAILEECGVKRISMAVLL